MHYLLLFTLFLTACSSQKDTPVADKSKMESAFANAMDPGRIPNQTLDPAFKYGEVITPKGYSTANKRLIVGYVFDIDDKTPIANTRVVFTLGMPINPWHDLFVVTDDGGRYQVEVNDSGIPYFAVSFKPGFAYPGKPDDERGIAYLGQDISRISGQIPPILMQKKNSYCATQEADFGPCMQAIDLQNLNKTSCNLNDTTSGVSQTGGCVVWKCQRRCD